MIAIKPSYEILNMPEWDEVLIGLEKAIRTCYKSEKAINAESADKLIRNIIKRGHESTLEHHSMSVRFICDRGVSHELVRHRLCSFSQESTRYVNYSPSSKNNQGDMKFILPCWMDTSFLGTWDNQKIINAVDQYKIDGVLNNCDVPASYDWVNSVLTAQQDYNVLIDKGWNAEHARTVLPNSLKTEIVVTTNIRDWRHLLALRCDATAHPQMRELMVPLYEELKDQCPTLFDSIEFEYEDWTTIKTRATKETKPVVDRGTIMKRLLPVNDFKYLAKSCIIFERLLNKGYELNDSQFDQSNIALISLIFSNDIIERNLDTHEVNFDTEIESILVHEIDLKLKEQCITKINHIKLYSCGVKTSFNNTNIIVQVFGI